METRIEPQEVIEMITQEKIASLDLALRALSKLIGDRQLFSEKDVQTVIDEILDHRGVLTEELEAWHG